MARNQTGGTEMKMTVIFLGLALLPFAAVFGQGKSSVHMRSTEYLDYKFGFAGLEFDQMSNEVAIVKPVPSQPCVQSYMLKPVIVGSIRIDQIFVSFYSNALCSIYGNVGPTDAHAFRIELALAFGLPTDGCGEQCGLWKGRLVTLRLVNDEDDTAHFWFTANGLSALIAEERVRLEKHRAEAPSQQ
jgi:hypothetical protein